jgi:Arc/MetJ family transcription regulator
MFTAGGTARAATTAGTRAPRLHVQPACLRSVLADTDHEHRSVGAVETRRHPRSVLTDKARCARAAQEHLGTATIKDTVNAALNRAIGRTISGEEIDAALDVWASMELRTS